MVVLRMKRMGRSHSPFYRLSAMDKRNPRDGAVIENLGWYSPTAKPGAQYLFHAERVKHWLSVGAQPSQTAANLLKKVGIDPTPGKKI
ncbi:MAG: ribosomal protein [Planctomycetota bacterium]|jgi:small subunit ribosomal protein S16